MTMRTLILLAFLLIAVLSRFAIMAGPQWANFSPMGAMALFGEKYGDVVRVISVGDWAHELCGGTHARRSAQLGLVKFLSESSIGAGTRRVEALVGADAYQFLAREHLIVSNLQEMLKGKAEELPEKISSLMQKLKDTEKEIEKFRKNQILSNVSKYLQKGHDLNGIRVINFYVEEEINAGDLRDLVTNVKGQSGAGASVVVAASVFEEKVNVVVAVNEAGQKMNLNAGNILKEILSKLEGKGGGKADLAQGAGTKTFEAKSVIENIDGFIK